ncbi:putative flavin-binding monooxygenase [Microdochium bolleyi]|uniref:Putative flavin-binding monooxygenase n=1 Tax=Microdochium bolleyi TaxID=196109 RepID=A0A136IR90_9PEZI|nr:putative flavin-binding monooxygenase [Microdochium bolleyi]
MSTDTDVLIIGGGMSGIGMAAQLRRNYPSATFEIYEKTSDIGGTWAINTYPGCGVDVPSHFYSYSFALNPDWSRKFTMQDEILAYFHGVAARFDLPKHTRLQCAVEKAVWDEKRQIWSVTIRDVAGKRTFQRTCKALVSAVGALSVPKKCDIPGHEDFQGKLFHSARWEHSFDHAGKDVLVLGNGCSATQFVPVVAQSAKRVVQVVRQPHWLLERPNPTYSRAFQLLMRIPGVMQLLRAKIYAELEAEWTMFETGTGAEARRKLGETSRRYIRENAPAQYVDSLIPKFEVGCKRRVFDTGYLECLHRKNVDLVTGDGVESITKTGVVFKSGRKLDVDAIVLATGFETTTLLSPLEIVGKDGVSINEHWKRYNQGLPQAYYGTCIAGFPNFFVMMGPNTVNGHLSVIFSSECQINYTLRMLDPVLRSASREVAAVEIKQAAEDAENDWIQDRAKQLVWSTGCTNWYVEPKTAKNLMVYPHWQWHYWLRSIFIPSCYSVDVLWENDQYQDASFA